MTDQSQSAREMVELADRLQTQLDGELERDGSIDTDDLQKAIAVLRLSDEPPAFYGAQCPSYPACTGGCGLGCTQEIKQARAARSSDESGGVRKATIEECAKIADLAALRCVREQIPGDSVANHVAQNIRALLQTESK